jgi:hypothetical protein
LPSRNVMSFSFTLEKSEFASNNESSITDCSTKTTMRFSCKHSYIVELKSESMHHISVLLIARRFKQISYKILICVNLVINNFNGFNFTITNDMFTTSSEICWQLFISSYMVLLGSTLTLNRYHGQPEHKLTL